MTSVQLLLNPIWSWPWIVLTGGVMLGVVLWTYPPRIRHLPAGRRRVLLTLRLLAGLVLLFAMLRPTLQFTEKDDDPAVLIVAGDVSRSMNTPDGPAGMTRRDALLKVIKDHEAKLKELGEKVQIQYMDFAVDAVGVEAPDPKADGKFTAIGKVLDEIRRNETGKRLGGIMLMSDFAQRALGEDDIDPRASARRFVEQRGVPIHPILFGTSEVSASGLDLGLDNLMADPLVFERKTTPVKVQLIRSGAAGRPVQVKLQYEDRSGVGPNQPGTWKDIPSSAEARSNITLPATNKNSERIDVTLSFVAEQPGEYKIAVEAVPLEGEIRRTNNRLETIVNVTKGGLKVAYFDVASPEQAFIRKLNQTARIQLDMQVIPGGELMKNAKIDKRWFLPNSYDVYVIGDVPASVFKQGGEDLLELLKQRVDAGAGLAMLGGIHNYDAGGYGRSPIADYLPVKLKGAAGSGPIPGDHISQRVQVLPTGTGLDHYLMMLDPQNNERAWKSLPKLSGATRIAVKSGASEVLAESEAGDPLLIATDVGRSRVAALAVNETWMWYLRGHRDLHQRFWQQLLLWLAHKEFDTDAPVWVRVDPRNFGPGGRVPILFGARDKNRAPIKDAEFQVEVVRPDGSKQSVTPQKAAEGGQGEFVGTDLPGDYWVTVKATKDGKSLGVQATTRFLVDSRDIELDNPAANPELAQEIAAITGSLVVTPETFGEFLDQLLAQGVTTEMTRQRLENLWDGWPLLLVFATLMSAEWYLRKSRGLV
jgi:uncharacterized membrane protein